MIFGIVVQLKNRSDNLFSIINCLNFVRPDDVRAGHDQVFQVVLVFWYPLDFRCGVLLIDLTNFGDFLSRLLHGQNLNLVILREVATYSQKHRVYPLKVVALVRKVYRVNGHTRLIGQYM